MKYHLALIITTILWGSAYIVSKILLGSIDAYTLVFFRFLIATIVVAIYGMIFRYSLWQSWRQGIVLGLFSFLSYFLIVYGMNDTSASVSGFLTALFVIFVPVFSWIWYRKKLSFMQWGAVCLGVIGLVFVTGGVSAIGKGELFVIAGAMTVAIYILIADEYMKNAEHNLVALTFQQMLFNTLGGLILGLVFQSSFLIPTSTVWLVYFLQF
jgi:drug/metabolite transporter (DMT)-like permease